LSLYFIHNLLKETELELIKKIQSYQEMNFEKFSFIGKIDKIESDFNTYLEQIEAMKNVDFDPNQMHTPEFYLQTIINRKRPETAVPCDSRTNKKPSFDESEIKIKSSRIKTSINKRESINKGNIMNKKNEGPTLNNKINKNENKNFIGNFEDMFEFDPEFIENNMQNEIVGEPINIDNINEESAFPNRPQAFTTTIGRGNNNRRGETEKNFNNFRFKNSNIIRSNQILLKYFKNLYF